MSNMPKQFFCICFVLLCIYASNVQDLVQQIEQANQDLSLTKRSTTSFDKQELTSRRMLLLKKLAKEDANSVLPLLWRPEQLQQEFGNVAVPGQNVEQAVALYDVSMDVIVTMLEDHTPGDEEVHADATEPYILKHNMRSQIDRIVVDYAEHNEPRTYTAYVTNATSHVQTTRHANISGFLLGNDVLVVAQAVPLRQTRQAPSSWSTGTKRILYIRVDMNDFPGDPISSADAEALLKSLQTYWKESSYNQLNVASWTITPTMRLPQAGSFYGPNYLVLMNDARTKAASMGYRNTDYDLDVIMFPRIAQGWSGRGYVGAAGTWINGNTQFYPLAHELGHNIGLWHSNYMISQENPPVSFGGRGSNEEYGDYFDIMGRCYDIKCHYNLRNKLQLQWLSQSNIATPAASGQYAIVAHDTVNAKNVPSVPLGLRIYLNKADTSIYYLLSYRSQAVGNNYMSNGAVELHVAYSNYDSINSTHYLDTIPATTSVREPMQVGQTWTSNTNTPRFMITVTGTSCNGDTKICTAGIRYVVFPTFSFGNVMKRYFL